MREAMTRDERKFDRIGLGDPATGGTGALLEVGDGQGNSFAKLLVGHRDGRSYVRKPDDLQAWAVAGAVMPPLQRGAAWLDLDVLEISAEQIAGADVRPAQGPAYRLVAAPGGGFALAPPHDRRQVLAALGANADGGGADAVRADRCRAGAGDRDGRAGGRAHHAAGVRRRHRRAQLAEG